MEKQQGDNRKSKDNNKNRLREIVVVLKKHEVIHGITPEKLRLIIEDLGPTYVKLGQIMSMRSDLLPQSYCEELVKLRTDVKPVDFGEVVALIEQEYGVPIQEVFPTIEEKPLGSASIAQVHRVTLKNGKKAVVKVQRPGIQEVMAKDIALIRKAAKLLKIIEGPADVLDFNKIIEELWVVSQQEMDFLLEARNCRELAELNEQIVYVAFPNIERHLTTSRVLVMEYIEGIPVDEMETLRRLGYDMDEIGAKLADNYAKQILDDGYFHADPHPGNIWIRDGKIVWLDLGMVGKLNQRDKTIIKNAVIAIADNDIYQLKDAILTLGKAKKTINHSQLYSDIELLLSRYGSLDFESMNIGEMVQEILEVCQQHAIAIPASVTMLARGLMTIEGVLKDCSPEVNFIDIVSAHLSAGIMEDIDFSKEFRQTGKQLVSKTRKLLDVPNHLSDFLRMAVKGQAKMNLDVTGAEEPIKQIGKMVDKVIICIISAALLIGSSLISTTQMRPQVLDIPLFGILGFLGSTILSTWLLYGVIKNGWKK
ncbi:MAG: ABC1 kinase family protein [Bacillus sp. (in: firmicutes)]